MLRPLGLAGPLKDLFEDIWAAKHGLKGLRVRSRITIYKIYLNDLLSAA